MFEWHFTIRGAADTDFAGGVYHGRILLPPEYPFKPPNIVFLTPSGRFETGVMVCLSFSAHHPELWQPAWGIRLILEALISFLPTPADGAIGALDWTAKERKKLAKESGKFRCPVCCAEGETCVDLLPELKPKAEGEEKAKKKTKFQEEIEKLKMLQFQNHAAEEAEAKGEGKADESAEAAAAEGGEGNAAQPDGTGVAPTLQQSEQQGTVSEITALMASEDATSQPTRSALGAPQLGAPVNTATTEENSSVATEAAAGSTATEDQSAATEMAVIHPPPNPPANNPPANNQAARDPPGANAPAATRATTDASTFATMDLEDDPPLVSDNILNGLIGFFAVFVVYLLRQAQSLVDELHSLDEKK